jgi:hypothetical protein
MGKLGIDKQILKELMSRDLTLEELTCLFGDVQKYCANLVSLRMISSLDSGEFGINCPVCAGKNKKILTRDMTTLEEIYTIFDKRKNAKRTEDSYVRYDDSKGRGSPDDWKKAAQSLLESTMDKSEYLKVLGLKENPKTLKELRQQYLYLIKKEHPDKGGSSKKATQVIEAYKILKKLF